MNACLHTQRRSPAKGETHTQGFVGTHRTVPRERKKRVGRGWGVGEHDVKSVARRGEIVQLNTKARTKFHLCFLEVQMQLLFQSAQM